MSMRRQLVWTFLLVAVALLALVMLGLNAGVWYRVNHPMHMGPGMMGPGGMMGQGGRPGLWPGSPGGPGTGGPGPGYTDTWRLTLQWSLIAGLAGVGVAIGASLIISERIARPIRRLAGAARIARPVPGAFTVHPGDAAEIRDLADSLSRMTERLRAEDEARRNLFADVAHELRHPIALIRGKLESILDGVAPLEPESLSGLQDEMIRLGRLVGDLQDLSLAEVGALSLHLQPTDLAAQLERLRENFEPVAAGKGITLQFRLAETLPQVEADPDRFRQIVGNLLSNAVRHTPDGGRITITATAGSSGVEIRVSDTGPGIAPADLPYLFDRFYRADKSRTRATGGTGLGLSIARSLARLHGGDLTAGNAPGGGALFTFILPLPTARN